MTNVQKLQKLVNGLYNPPRPNADIWNSWGYPNHVLKVAEIAARLAQKYQANRDFIVAGALLHDIADAVMPRASKNHEAESLDIAKDLLTQAGFKQTDTKFIIDEIVKPHSCNDIMPACLGGKVLATADAMAHFTTDFYPYFNWEHFGGVSDEKNLAGFKQWVLKKIEKDYHRKIFFQDEKKQIKPNYDAIKRIYSL